MQIVRDYRGLDRTTVVYDIEITGVGGTAEEFYVVAEVGAVGESAAARTTVQFSHDEMRRILADYRRHYPIDAIHPRPLLGGPQIGGRLRKLQRRLTAVFGRCRAARRPAAPSERRDDA